MATGATDGAVTTELRVRYAETDAMGVVYYANYLVWFELGRTDWIRAQGITYREFEEQGILLPVVQASCTYKSSAHYDDLVRITTTVTGLTRTRVAFGYRVTRQEPEPGMLLAEGQTEHVFLTRTGRPTRLDRRPHLWSALAAIVADHGQAGASSTIAAGTLKR
ncbi:MAG: acyl-CoA thioesterase [Thermomicrobiales bacterium]